MDARHLGCIGSSSATTLRNGHAAPWYDVDVIADATITRRIAWRLSRRLGSLSTARSNEAVVDNAAELDDAIVADDDESTVDAADASYAVANDEPGLQSIDANAITPV